MNREKKKNISFKDFLSKTVTRLFLVFLLSIGFVFAFIIRKNIVETRKNYYKSKLNEYNFSIISELSVKQQELVILSKILQSQINVPRVYYNLSKLMQDELLQWQHYKRIFIILDKQYTVKDTVFYKYRDSLERINISWVKNDNGIILIDNSYQAFNEFVYKLAIIKKSPILVKGEANSYNNEDIRYSLVIPLYQGTTFAGIIGIEFSPDFLEDLFRSSALNNYIFVSTQDGVILYSQLRPNAKGKNIFYLIPEFRQYEADLLNKSYLEIKKSSKFLLYKSIDTQFDANWHIGLIIPKKFIYRKANFWFFLIVLVSFIIPILLGLLIRFFLYKPFIIARSISNKTKALSEGKLDENFDDLQLFNEIAVLTSSLSFLQGRLYKLKQILLQIKEQKVVDRLEIVSDKDELGIALEQTLKAIEERSKARMKNEEQKQKEEWINEGLNKLHEASKIGNDSLELLTNNVNKSITLYSDAFLSIFYIKKTDEKGDYLETISTIGLGEKKAFKKRIGFGEGIVGTIALERKMLYFDKIPEDYHLIVTGLSMMKPKSIMVLPLIYEDELFGIVELGFLKILQDYEITFFEKASSEIALSIRNIINNIRTTELLDQMRQQNMEIEKTKKELEKKIWELRRKEKEAKDKEVELKAIIAAVNNTLLTIEYTTDGTLITANDKYLRTMHYTLNELRGVNVLDLVKSERAELEEIIRKVSHGESIQRVVKRFTKYGEIKWLYSTYTPYYNAEGKITKILYFAFDITEKQNYIEKLEKEIKLLKINTQTE